MQHCRYIRQRHRDCELSALLERIVLKVPLESDFFRNSFFRCFGRKVSSFEVENGFREEKIE